MPNGTFKELILVMNSIAVPRAKFEKFGGPESHLSGTGRLDKY